MMAGREQDKLDEVKEDEVNIEDKDDDDIEVLKEEVETVDGDIDDDDIR